MEELDVVVLERQMKEERREELWKKLFSIMSETKEVADKITKKKK